MASSSDNGNKLVERLDSRPMNNSRSAKWLATNLEEMEQKIELMMNLIEDDGDSFARRAEMYYKMRPELISNVKDFQRMYRELADRYAQQTVDLQRIVSPDVGSESTSPWLSPDPKLNRFRSTQRAAGFDFFLGSASTRPARDEESSSSDSDSEGSDTSSVHNYRDVLHEKTIQMDAELYNEGETDHPGLLELQLKIATYEEEITNLKAELEFVRSSNGSETDVSDPTRLNRGRIFDLEKQNARLQDQLTAAQRDANLLKLKLDSKVTKTSRWKEKVAKYKTSLTDRIHEIQGLKETHTEVSRLNAEKAQLEEKLRDLEAQRKNLGTDSRDDDLDNLIAERDALQAQVAKLVGDANKTRIQMGKLAGDANRMRIQIAKLQQEVEKQKGLVVQGAEEKREAIRQLCVSLEHYRNAYEQLRRSEEHPS